MRPVLARADGLDGTDAYGTDVLVHVELCGADDVEACTARPRAELRLRVEADEAPDVDGLELRLDADALRAIGELYVDARERELL